MPKLCKIFIGLVIALLFGFALDKLNRSMSSMPPLTG